MVAIRCGESGLNAVSPVAKDNRTGSGTAATQHQSLEELIVLPWENLLRAKNATLKCVHQEVTVSVLILSMQLLSSYLCKL